MPPKGGLKTDGQKVDPVSGNSVPVGSNANEVRDDIPAQLSDGEYVVPSDIVRYYGVKFFEDLRNQGKGGLSQMAANGRIGGEPVPAGGPQASGLSNDEMQEMQNMVGAAMGGMMTQQMPQQQQQINPDPYSQQSSMYKQPQGYDNGGDTYYPGGTPAEQAATTPRRYTGEFSWETKEPEKEPDDPESTAVTLYCPDGSINTLQLPADQDRYDTLVATGCGLDQSIVRPKDDNDDPGTNLPEITEEQRNAWMKDYGYKGDGTETFEDIIKGSQDAMDGGNKNFIEKLLSGGVFGKLQAGTVAAQVAGNIIILSENLGDEKSNPNYDEQKALLDSLKAQRAKYVKENGLSLLEGTGVINGDQFSKQVNSTQIDWALSFGAVDPDGKSIWKDKADFIKHLEGVSSDPENGIIATYDPTSGAVKYTYDPDKYKLGEIKPPIRPGSGSDDGGPEGGDTGGDTQITPVGDEEDADNLDDLITAPPGEQVTIIPPNNEDFINDVIANPDDFLPPIIPVGDEEDADNLEDLGTIYNAPPVGDEDDADNLEDLITTPTPDLPTYPVDDADALEDLITTPPSDPPYTPPVYTPPEGDDDDELEVYVPPPADDGPGFDPSAPPDSGGYNDSSSSSSSSSNDDDPNSIFNPNSPINTAGKPSYTNPASDPYAEPGRPTKSSSSSNQTSSSTASANQAAASTASSGGCCFIMLEARYGDGTMDEVVRRYRNEHMNDRNRRGYYKVAEVFVPLMRKSKIFKWIVTKTFADPLVSYGKYYYGQNKHGVIYSPLKNFWMKVFYIVGGNTEFIRENGEVV